MYRPRPSNSFCVGLVGLVFRMAISVSGGICFVTGGRCPKICPHRLMVCNATGWTAAETKKAGNPCCCWVSGLIGTVTVRLMVEVGGIEPPSEGAPSLVLHA